MSIVHFRNASLKEHRLRDINMVEFNSNCFRNVISFLSAAIQLNFTLDLKILKIAPLLCCK